MKKEQKLESFIADYEQRIADKVKQTIYNSEQFYKSINKLIKDYDLGLDVVDEATLEAVIKILKSKIDDKHLASIQSLKNVQEDIHTIDHLLKSKETKEQVDSYFSKITGN